LGRSFSQSIDDVPFCHGCFMMFKSDIYKKLHGFDKRFFIYMEDADIFIRAKHYGKTVLNPDFSITHEHRRGSAKNMKLLLWHIISAMKFFWKHS
ncbi:MAG: galactosyltransferase-related protein, partial [Campylobacterota bacterium]|nr:galactosyltransferase-related protein [Campylobacterota bacterium]